MGSGVTGSTERTEGERASRVEPRGRGKEEARPCGRAPSAFDVQVRTPVDRWIGVRVRSAERLGGAAVRATHHALSDRCEPVRLQDVGDERPVAHPEVRTGEGIVRCACRCTASRSWRPGSSGSPGSAGRCPTSTGRSGRPSSARRSSCTRTDRRGTRRWLANFAIVARFGFLLSIAPSTPPQEPETAVVLREPGERVREDRVARWPSPQIGVALFSKITCCSPTPSVKFGAMQFCRSAATFPACRKFAKSLPVPDPDCVA